MILLLSDRLDDTVFKRVDDRENVADRVDVRVTEGVGETPATGLFLLGWLSLTNRGQ